MNRESGRKLTAEQQTEKRKITLRVRINGHEYVAIGKSVGVHPRTVQYWWPRYQEEGLKAAVEGEQRGHEVGRLRTLKAEQEWLIQQLISEKKPERVEAWLKDEYPLIAERAKAEGAEIHWGDETGVRSDCQHGRSYAPAGKTPVQRVSGSRFSSNMISTVTNQGKVRFMLYQETLTAPVLIRFLARLIRDAGRKIFLILDNLRVHHRKKVRAWLEKHTDLIEVFFLPAYSPELNPDEYLNCDLKAQVHGGKPPKNRDELESRVRGAMMKLQNRPARVVAYFKNPKIQYAA